MVLRKVYLKSAAVLLLTMALVAYLASIDWSGELQADISGEWELLHTESDGVVYPDEQAHGVHLNMQDSIFSIYRVRSDEIFHGRYLITNDFDPPHLDIWVEGIEEKGLKRNGIYRLKGDTLEACFAAPGAYRPSYFETRKGDKQVLTIWIRRSAKN